MASLMPGGKINAKMWHSGRREQGRGGGERRGRVVKKRRRERGAQEQRKRSKERGVDQAEEDQVRSFRKAWGSIEEET